MPVLLKYCMMARKKGTAIKLQRVRNLIIEEPSAVESTEDENPDLDGVSIASHSSDSRESSHDATIDDATTAAGDQAPLETGARRQRAESDNHEADDAASPAKRVRSKAYLPEVCVTQRLTNGILTIRCILL